jgi:hypothetical protein
MMVELLDDLTRTFLLMTTTIFVLGTIIFLSLATTLVALFFLLILMAPISIIIYGYMNRKAKTEQASLLDMLRQVLVCMYSISFTSWIFDVCTTYYVLDVLNINVELNPLGWPLGALGALLFFAPVSILTYLLLFKVKKIYAIISAMITTVLTLYLGFQNFIAASQNLSFIYPSISATSQVYRYLFVAALACNITYVVTFSSMTLRKTSKTRVTARAKQHSYLKIS